MTKKYTIKNLADELHVSKTAIRKIMNESFREQFVESSGNTIQVSEEGANVIREHFQQSNKAKDAGNKAESSQKQEQKDSGNQAELVSVLKEQLANRNDELAEMRKMLSQSQELLLNTQNENRKLLALQMPETTPETIVPNVEETAPNKETEQKQEPETEAATKKKRWWQWMH
jgi:hypothetical protein